MNSVTELNLVLSTLAGDTRYAVPSFSAVCAVLQLRQTTPDTVEKSFIVLLHSRLPHSLSYASCRGLA